VSADTNGSTDNLTLREKRIANLIPWQPGQSGNPKGRSKEQGEIERLAKDRSKRALERIIELVESTDERIALMAAKEVLDRAFGRAKQSEDADVDGRQLTINIVRYSDGNQPPAQLDTATVSVRPLALSGNGRQEGPGGLSS
jgi:hypothetical protein